MNTSRDGRVFAALERIAKAYGRDPLTVAGAFQSQADKSFILGRDPEEYVLAFLRSEQLARREWENLTPKQRRTEKKLLKSLLG